MGSTAAPGTREQVLTALFQSHCVELVRLAYVILGDRQGAEEAVQDAYLSLHRNWPLRDEQSALAYLRSAVINRCRSGQRRLISARRQEPQLRAGLRAQDSAADVSSEVVARDEADRLADLVRGLAQRQREVIICRYYLQLSEKETAALLEIGIGSVKRHAHRGLATLHTRLEDPR